jgi:hypothetical protein
MPHQRPRLASALASMLAVAGIMLAAAGCSGHITPLGPGPAGTLPQTHHLQSPLILEDMHAEGPAGPSGGCPAGSSTFSQGPGPCYHRTGTPVTVTSAAVSAVFVFQPPTPSGQQAQPAQYGFWITLPAADVPALATIIPTAPAVPGPPRPSVATSATAIPAISVAGTTWVLQGYAIRSAGQQLEVTLPSRNQALQLQRLLAASG